MPRLLERLRGKSGDDLLNEVKSAFDTDRRMFFERPAWSNRNPAFPRGFPFSDDEEEPPRRARWDDLRGRRPATEGPSTFQAHHEPPWEEEDLRKKRPRSPPKAQPESGPAPPTHGLNQHGLRNTVPFAQNQDSKEENQRTRAMSAPPGDRQQQRFVSTCEIPLQQPAQSHPQQQTPPQHQQQTQSSNVRVIPIQVEGRDEPLVNSNIDTSTNFGAEKPPSFDGRLPRDFGPYRKHSSRFGATQSPPPYAASHSPPPQQQHTKQQQTPPQQQQAKQQQAPPQPQEPIPQPPPRQKSTAADEVDKGAPTVTDPVAIALARVAAVQKEVDALAGKVDVAKPSSRKDKEYMYLDEMLTRELIKLDDIDTAGQDSVRQARKDTIRSIQKCISLLESKVPGEPMDVVSTEETVAAEPMAEEAVQETAVVAAESEEPVSADPTT